MHYWILTASKDGAKFHQDRPKIATVKA